MMKPADLRKIKQRTLRRALQLAAAEAFCLDDTIRIIEGAPVTDMDEYGGWVSIEAYISGHRITSTIVAEADEDIDEPICERRSPTKNGLTSICTRRKGHKGPHVARGENYYPYATWGRGKKT